MNAPAPPSSTRALATGIVRRLRDAGFTALWVGGCVRDLLLAREAQDYDIVTSAHADQIEALFPHTIPVGRSFGVVIVVVAGQQFQVATFRAEADYRDGRRPGTVTFGDAQADARRRDFTINGLYFDPLGQRLHDWVGGEADLRARVVRTIGEPRERFGEDHLRLLRAVRFAAQLDFAIAPETFAAVRALAERIRLISAERVREELMKLFRPPHAARGLDLLRDSALLEHILPELAATLGCPQPPEHHPEGDVFTHVRLMLGQMRADAAPLLPWAVLLHDIAKPRTTVREADGRIRSPGHDKLGAEITETILRRLRFSNKEVEEVATVVRHHMTLQQAPQMRKATLRRLLLRPTFPLELELHRLDCLGSHRRLEVYEFLVAQAEELARQPALIPPLVTGHDLLALGLASGPALGQLLRDIRERQLQDELRTRAEALEFARGKLAGRP